MVGSPQVPVLVASVGFYVPSAVPMSSHFLPYRLVREGGSILYIGESEVNSCVGAQVYLFLG